MERLCGECSLALLDASAAYRVLLEQMKYYS